MSFRVSRFAASTLVVAAIVPSALSGQVIKVAEYNWQKQDLNIVTRPRSGTDVSITVTGLNSMCYDYAVTLNQVKAVEQTATFKDALSKVSALAGDPAALKQDPGKEPESKAPGDTGTLKTQTVKTPPEDPIATANKDIDAASAQQVAAAAVMASFGAKIKFAADARDKSAKAIQSYYKLSCGANGGRGSDKESVARASANAVDVAKQFKQIVSDLGALDVMVDKAKEHLSAADALLNEIGSERRTKAYQLHVSHGRAAERVVGITENVSAIRKQIEQGEKDIEMLSKDAENLEPEIAIIEQNPTDQSVTRTIPLDQMTESVDVVLVATGKDGIEITKGVKLEDKFSLSVYRRNRFFVTGGILMSTLKERKYERINVIDPTVKDSVLVYSTFVDTRNSNGLAFAPTVMANMSLFKCGFDWVFTTGVASREVAGRTAADFVAGLSAGFGDRFVATAALHFGRVETLLIGSDDAVRARPVPDVVSRESAIGDQWKRALGIIFSYKL